MKKFTLFAAAAVCAVCANAQYTTAEPYANQSVVAGQVATFDVVSACDGVLAGLEGAGQKVNDIRVDDTNRFLYVWDNTFVGGDGSYPGVGYSDFQYDGYMSLNVGEVGWSGAGYFISEAAGFNNKHWTDQTRFHIAARTASVAPASVALIIGDGDPAGSSPAKFALGESFNDGGAIYPTIGAGLSDEWVGYSISFADLKKLYPTFAYVGVDAWQGNIFSFLGGGVSGQNISFDCVYFYTPGDDSGVAAVADDANFVVTRNTVNVANGNGIQLYDLSGRMIKSVEGTTLGISELGSGIYVAKSGNSVKKIVK